MPPSEEPPLPPEPSQDEDSRKNHDRQVVSITLSPIHLLFPVFEAQIEVKPTPHLGLAVIGGIGSTKYESSIGDTKFAVYELGAQIIGYPLRDFSSLQLGAEVMYLHVSTEQINGQNVSAAAGGVAVGPLVGYKVLTKAGFTFFVQGGFEYVAIKANDDQGNNAEQSSVIPLLNLNLGWSF